MAQIYARILNGNAPLTSPGTLPTITIFRSSDDTAVVSASSMVEVGQGLYRFEFASVDGLEYGYVIDADPAGAGQVEAHQRHAKWGVVSGTTDARIETDIPALPAAVWAVDLRGFVGVDFARAGDMLSLNNLYNFGALYAAPGNPGTLSLFARGDDPLVDTALITFELRDTNGLTVVGVSGTPARRNEAAAP